MNHMYRGYSGDDKPYPQRHSPLPRQLSDITPATLTRLLGYRYPGIAVESMEVTGIIESHTTKLWLRLTFNGVGRDAGIPAHVCVKANFTGEHLNVDICELEARFYHYLSPSLGDQVATCYYADWDNDGQGLIIFEDLEQRGGRFSQTTDHHGIEGTVQALEDLAKLHATLWNSPALTQHPWLPLSMQTPIDNDQIRIMQYCIDLNLANPNYRKVIPATFLENPDRLQSAYDGLIAWEQAQDSPYCLLLGDCHPGNAYIKPDGHRIWIDWQLARKGRPWRDLTYLMISMLTIDERRQSERDLLRHYRECLLACGVTAVADEQQIFEHYRRWVIYGLQVWLGNLDSWQVGVHLNERFFTAAVDLGTWQALL